MIPSIGLLIGAYTFVRLLSLMTREGERAENTWVKIFALLAMIGTVLICIGLVVTSMTSSIPATSFTP